MAFSEFEQKRYEKIIGSYIETRRPEPKIRTRLDISYRVSGQSVEVFEVRPNWKDSSVINEHPIAKATYVKTTNNWKIYWMKSDLKWHEYEPDFVVNTLEQFINVLDTDEFGSFWG
ncbi:DUF3024 domain-containing protein [Vibrio sp. EA2]|uniref:DUF3024 domain-containing protein n=1 Tax=Vibrio sp. EA2 TaxID=3079860 RepID=UPI00294978BA|nr:DUF3024 domain-containing protein [Vibrio sp. EA2]MDV6250870.1 DUF3024 domain-containing protein [Vibrio sp. EA2]